MNILVTGGAGYIGSHVAKQLSAAGFRPIVYDSLVRGHRSAVRWGELIVGDIRDEVALEAAFRRHRPEAVLHFAALCYVGESMLDPAPYFETNVAGTVQLLSVMRKCDVNRIVFSSSCATYGIPPALPITEETPQNPVNPYGWTKLAGEQALKAYSHAYGLRGVMLRYFNACGADPEGELGELHDPETHLIPRVLMAAAGEIKSLEIFGDDYPTADGTCVRDYIHVSDLANAHVAALRYLLDGGATAAFNLGTGQGLSIRQIIRAVEEVTGRKVPASICPRRPGDPPELVASGRLAEQALGVEPVSSDLRTIIRTAWDWRLKCGPSHPAASPPGKGT
jgi:UDP-arabinose 4-epimerase